MLLEGKIIKTTENTWQACYLNLKYAVGLTRIFHEYATIHPLAGMNAGIVTFMLKDSLYQARRLPNANLFRYLRNAHTPYASARRYHLGNSLNIRVCKVLAVLMGSVPGGLGETGIPV